MKENVVALSDSQQAQVDELKKKAPSPLPSTYTDDELWAMILASSENAVLLSLWDEQASKTASYFDVSEGSSRRNLGDIHDNAVKRASYFRAVVAGETGDSPRRPRTRAIVRPS